VIVDVVNPNTTGSMTALVAEGARAAAGPGTTVRAVTSRSGPASIESHYDEALAVPGLLEAVLEGSATGADAHVVACFGDPGLDACREVARGPVLGIAEAAMHAAVLVGRSFSVVTTLGRTTARARELAVRYGFGEHCAGVHACEIPVLELETDPLARATIAAACARALDDDGSDVLVLGCAGMTDLAASLSAELGVPVVDGVAAAVGMAQGLVMAGLSTSRRGEYARPPAKAYAGDLQRFALG
jgi:allantoin racemase